jgi:hypothetical protein
MISTFLDEFYKERERSYSSASAGDFGGRQKQGDRPDSPLDPDKGVARSGIGAACF